jgi:hypothetical protein
MICHFIVLVFRNYKDQFFMLCGKAREGEAIFEDTAKRTAKEKGIELKEAKRVSIGWLPAQCAIGGYHEHHCYLLFRVLDCSGIPSEFWGERRAVEDQLARIGFHPDVIVQTLDYREDGDEKIF